MVSGLAKAVPLKRWANTDPVELRYTTTPNEPSSRMSTEGAVVVSREPANSLLADQAVPFHRDHHNFTSAPTVFL